MCVCIRSGRLLGVQVRPLRSRGGRHPVPVPESHGEQGPAGQGAEREATAPHGNQVQTEEGAAVLHTSSVMTGARWIIVG